MADRPLPFDPIEEARRQWTARGWGDAAPGMAAITSVMRAEQILLARVDEVLRPFELTFARFEALALLSFSQRGTLPLSKVGRRLQVHPTSVTNIIDRLERQGFARRVPHPTDRRTTLAEITPEGRTAVAKATEALNRDAFVDTGLSDTELAELFTLLRKLRASAGDFDD
ncbi:MAG: MarR family winged helix-turn-helix transcriptional regulator [Acidimicrobiales bacterium]